MDLPWNEAPSLTDILEGLQAMLALKDAGSNDDLRSAVLGIANVISPDLHNEMVANWGVYWLNKLPDEPIFRIMKQDLRNRLAIAFTEQVSKSVVINNNYESLLKDNPFQLHLAKGHPPDPCLELVITHELTHVQTTPSPLVTSLLQMMPPSFMDAFAHNPSFYKRLNENWAKVKRSL